MKKGLKLGFGTVLLLAASWVIAQTPTSPSGSAAGSQTGSSSTSMGQTGTTTQPSATGTAGSMGQTGTTGTSGTENGAMGAQQGTTPAANGSGITGCLSGLPVQGIYSLKEQQSGKTYRLTGNIEHLGPLVGNEVQISGQPTSMPTATSMGSPSNPAVSAEQQAEGNLAGAYQVTSVNKVADHCLEPGETANTSGTSSTTGTASTTSGTANTGTTATQPQNTQPGTTTPGNATPSSTTPGTQPETTPATQPPPTTQPPPQHH